MTETSRHPVDFSPFLDGDRSDRRYQEIRHHLESCRDCSETVRAWRSFEGMFRSPELEIEVPSFQWTRIRAGIESNAEPGWRKRLRLLLRSWRPAGAVLGLIAFAAVAWLEYDRYTERNQLIALSGYVRSETMRIRDADNPFRVAANTGENPFTKIKNIESTTNPFEIR